MDNGKISNNSMVISGTVENEPEVSHRIYGESFYIFKLKVNRLSGIYDILPVMISDRIVPLDQIHTDMYLHISGQLRSYNKIVDGVNRLVLTIFVKDLKEIEPEETDANEILIEGYVCKPTTYRITPFGREITDMLLAVNRAYNKSDYIPCIAWGRNARFADNFEVGDKISVEGRVQSREYEKIDLNGEKHLRTAFEVSVSKLEKLS